jgi:sphingosine kinase
MQDTLPQGAETNSEQGLQKNGGYLGPPPPPKQAPAAASEWRAVDGAFLLIWLNNVPFAGEYVMPAPLAKFSDGCLDLVIMKECPRWDLFQLLLKIRSGRHIKSKYVEYLKVTKISSSLWETKMQSSMYVCSINYEAKALFLP